MTDNMPRHTIRFERGHTMTCAELLVDGRKVSQCTFDKDVQQGSPQVEKWVRGYFHISARKKDDEV